MAFSSRVAPSLEIAALNERWAGWNVNKEVIDERNRRNGGTALDEPHARFHSLFIRPRPGISHATETRSGISGDQANLRAAIYCRGTQIKIVKVDNRSREYHQRTSAEHQPYRCFVVERGRAGVESTHRMEQVSNMIPLPRGTEPYRRWALRHRETKKSLKLNRVP